MLNQLSFEGYKQNNAVDIGIYDPEVVSILFDPHYSDPNLR